MIRIQSEGDLATLNPLPVGTLVTFDHCGQLLHWWCIGQIPAAIRDALGWDTVNVWIAAPALRHMLHDEGARIFPTPFEALNYLLTYPDFILRPPRLPGAAGFWVEADRLRTLGLLASKSTKWVDGIIEPRGVETGVYLRIFHFGPRHRIGDGERLWAKKPT